jgi:hypothetical protein
MQGQDRLENTDHAKPELLSAPKGSDNRMGWVRNLEVLERESEHFVVEYELGSECRIPGLLDYSDGKIICALMSTNEGGGGLWPYNLVLHVPRDRHGHNLKAGKGYYFKEGRLGELVALMSLFFRCRFYLFSSRHPPGDPRMGMTLKREYPFVRVDCNPAIHPPLFENADKNLAVDFKEFLDTVRALDPQLHQAYILACHHYARAVREVGVDSEMVFIRLVSAIEALCGQMKLDRKDDALEEQKIVALIASSNLSPEQQKELKSTFDVRKSGKKFIRFIEQYSSGYFKGGNFKAKRLKIKRADLEKVLRIIYNARSKYLHAGEPMFLSTPFKGGEKWDTDPILGMWVDSRRFDSAQKLPYAHFFEGLVRHCLLNYLKANSSQPAFALN